MADMEMEKSYSGFERFMFFVTPILFTLVLLGVLLTLFNIDLRNKFLEVGNRIPIVNKLLPDVPVDAGGNTVEQTLKATNSAKKIDELKALLAAKESELAKAVDAMKLQDQTVADLQSQVVQLKKSGEKKTLDDQQYQNHIASLAGMYASMTPGKAAPILQSMTLEETVLILDAMRDTDRVKIMEKMTPKLAADATMMMKDITLAKDKQVAALQARLKQQQQTVTVKSNTQLNQTQLGATFNAMPAANAGDLLVKMAEVNPAKTLQILNAVTDAARSGILAEMSKLNKGVTAQLVSKMMAGK
jgi:flagellar motility protein MotE (MotC chaperone)